MPVTISASTRAVWKIGAQGQARILFVDDSASSAPARRWPDTAMPGGRPGHLAFDPNDYPTLSHVRTLVPEYAALWDAVAEDLVTIGAAESAAGTRD
ncbi:hypothetical protein [Nocardia ignorata]|uniref:Uncharacterized protein n=1 Tax=Nocardia ignorata TaxID=145285 RepID=A0A4R6P4Q9_NOCIG|nr:hypothetical protein [Nocardia ignorata]TDP32768.1 hypothetical protein DFR75_1056 [Nocardia ignorata]